MQITGRWGVLGYAWLVRPDQVGWPGQSWPGLAQPGLHSLAYLAMLSAETLNNL